jgi:hypothetical protein
MPNVNLYIDCTNGISGDMLCRSLTELSDDASFVQSQQDIIREALHQAEHTHAHHHTHVEDHGRTEDNGHNHDGGHGQPHGYTHRSYRELQQILEGSSLDSGVKEVAQKIYAGLAVAEAQVHGETLDTVHFHEVGRPQAIVNMVGVAAGFTAIGPEQVYCSEVLDGIGTVLCAHGEIPVPVPAVRALMDASDLQYGTTGLNMEMVTPTGLAALLALDPTYLENPPAHSCVVKTVTASGDRSILPEPAKAGLTVCTF